MRTTTSATAAHRAELNRLIVQLVMCLAITSYMVFLANTEVRKLFVGHIETAIAQLTFEPVRFTLIALCIVGGLLSSLQAIFRLRAISQTKGIEARALLPANFKAGRALTAAIVLAVGLCLMATGARLSLPAIDNPVLGVIMPVAAWLVLRGLRSELKREAWRFLFNLFRRKPAAAATINRRPTAQPNSQSQEASLLTIRPPRSDFDH